MKTLEEIRSILSNIEPNEAMYAQLGEEDVPTLQQLYQEGEPWMAARTIFALSRIGGSDAYDTIVSAAADVRKEVRVAVAATTNVLPEWVAESVLDVLIDDAEIGVKKYAIRSLSTSSSVNLKDKLHRLSQAEGNEALKKFATDKLIKINENYLRL